MLLANDFVSCSSPFTDGLSSRSLPFESELIEIVLSLQVLTRLVVDFLLEDLLGNSSDTTQPF